MINPPRNPPLAAHSSRAQWARLPGGASEPRAHPPPRPPGAAGAPGLSPTGSRAAHDPHGGAPWRSCLTGVPWGEEGPGVAPWPPARPWWPQWVRSAPSGCQPGSTAGPLEGALGGRFPGTRGRETAGHDVAGLPEGNTHHRPLPWFPGAAEQSTTNWGLERTGRNSLAAPEVQGQGTGRAGLPPGSGGGSPCLPQGPVVPGSSGSLPCRCPVTFSSHEDDGHVGSGHLMTASSPIPSARTLFPRTVHSRVPGVRAPAHPCTTQSSPGQFDSEMIVTVIERPGGGHVFTLTTAQEVKTLLRAPTGAARDWTADATSACAP